jgi:hypothetical protein
MFIIFAKIVHTKKDSLVFFHMLFGPAWFCIEPSSTVLHVLLFSNRTYRMLFVLLKLFLVPLPPSGFGSETPQT